MRLENLKDNYYSLDESDLLKTAFFQKIINEDQHAQNWRGPFSAQQFKEVFLLVEAKNVKVDVKKSDPTFLYTKSAERSLGELPPSVAGRITARINDFVDHKKTNPLEPFGARDRVFADDHLRGFKHAHLTHDWSLVYKYDGQKNQFCIYGVFTHDQIGTGQPTNMRRIKRSAQSWDNQSCN